MDEYLPEEGYNKAIFTEKRDKIFELRLCESGKKRSRGNAFLNAAQLIPVPDNPTDTDVPETFGLLPVLL